MASTSSGSSTRSCSFTTNIPTTTTNVIVAYNVNTSLSSPLTWNSGAAGPTNITKVAQLTGTSVNAGASAGDLTSIVCTDGTTGFTHIREFHILNKSTTAGETLILDGSVSNSFWAIFASTNASALTIPPGQLFSLGCPLETIGWATAAAKVLQMKTGTGTPAYSMIFVGD